MLNRLVNLRLRRRVSGLRRVDLRHAGKNGRGRAELAVVRVHDLTVAAETEEKYCADCSLTFKPSRKPYLVVHLCLDHGKPCVLLNIYDKPSPNFECVQEVTVDSREYMVVLIDPRGSHQISN